MAQGGTNIFVYSIKGFKEDALCSKLEKALKRLHLSYNVTEINALDEFIKARLTSVPAIKIGNMVIPYDKHKPLEDTVRKVVTILNNKGKRHA